MTFTGSVAAINTALNGLAFVPNAGYAGTTSLSLSVDDLGNTGVGGAQATGGSVTIAVITPPAPATPPGTGPGTVIVPDPPSVTPPISPDSGGSGVLPVPTPDPIPAPAAQGPTTPDEPPVEESPGSLLPDAVRDRSAGGHATPAADSTQSTSTGRGFNVAFGGRDLKLLLSVPEQPDLSLANFALTSRDTQYATQTAIAALRSTALLNELDSLRNSLQDESRIQAKAVALTTAASLTLTVGYVFRLLRGGVLLSTVLSSLPAWRLVDPLPILGRLEDEDDDESDNPDESLESLVARKNRAAGNAQSGPEPA
jgi:hypothetical protein